MRKADRHGRDIMAVNQLQGQLSTDQLGELGGASDAVVVDAAGATSLIIPGGSMLLVADFAREGPDLIVEGPNGEEVIVRDYFTMENPPALQTEGGAQLTSDLVSRMAGTAAPQQFASDGSIQQAQPIGAIETLQGTVTAIRADGSRVTLQQGDQVYQGDVIETGAEAGIGMTFADGTTFSLGEGGRMVLDELIYDPETDEGTSAFSVVQGAFSFVSGAIAKSGLDAMTVRTPVATIGVRGTMVVGTAAQEGEESSVTLLQEEGGITGEIVVTNQAGSQVLNIPFQTTTVNSFFSAPTEPVVLPQSTINTLYQGATGFLPGTGLDGRDAVERDQGDGDDARSERPAEEGSIDPELAIQEDDADNTDGDIEAEFAFAEESSEIEALDDMALELTEDDTDEPGEVFVGLAEALEAAEADFVDIAGIDEGDELGDFQLVEAVAAVALEADVDPEQMLEQVFSGEVALDAILETSAPGPGTPQASVEFQSEFGLAEFDMADVISFEESVFNIGPIDSVEASSLDGIVEDVVISFNEAPKVRDDANTAFVLDSLVAASEGSLTDALDLLGPTASSDIVVTVTELDDTEVTQSDVDVSVVEGELDNFESTEATVADITFEAAPVPVIDVTPVIDMPPAVEVTPVPVIDAHAVTGFENESITLDIGVTLIDAMGSEAITSITVSGVPSGASLSAGTELGDGTWTLTPAQLSGLTLIPPVDSNTDFSLTVAAIVTADDGATATDVATFDIDIVGVAGQPIVTAQDVSGDEDSAIPLDISAALNDAFDGSEIHTIVISGVPAGAQLSAGTNDGEGNWLLVPAQLDGLAILPSTNSNTDFSLTVTATAVENDGDTASQSVTFDVDVVGVADDVDVMATAARGAEDTAIPLDIEVVLEDDDGSERITAITIGAVPDGAALSAGTDNGDGTWTLSPDQLDDLTIMPPSNSDLDFHLTVTATTSEEDGVSATATVNIEVVVDAVADLPALSVSVTDPIVATSYSDTVEALRPVGYWRFEEASGAEADDSMAADNDGIYAVDGKGKEQIALGVPGVTGDTSAVALSGGYVEIPHDDNMLLDQGSVQFWFNTDNVDKRQGLFSKDSRGYDDGGHLSMFVDDGLVFVRLQSDDASFTVSSTVEVVASEWNQVAFNFGPDGMELFVNGQLAGTNRYAGGLGGSSGGSGNEEPIVLGANQWASGDGVANKLSNFFTGRVDEFAVYETPLSGPQVSELYNSATGSGSGDSIYRLNVEASLADTDGSEALTLVVSGVPLDAALSAGHDNGDGSWTLTPGQLAGLTLTVSSEISTDFTLTVTATATEENGESISTVQAVVIDVPEPVVPEPIGPTNGNDILTGTESADVMISLAGDDEVYGLGGDDSLDGGLGNDSLFGGAGDDNLTGGVGANLIYGDEGIDTVDYSDAVRGVTVDLGRGTARSTGGRSMRDTLSDVENVVGSSRSDRIVGDGVNNDLDGGAGNDRIYGGSGDDNLDGGDGHDRLYAGNGDDELIGGDGNDRLRGESGADVLVGGHGNDDLRGDSGDDVLTGGAGDDYLSGGSGDDQLSAGEGNDRIYGGSGDDLLDGGDGNDRLSAGSGEDILYGREGTDDIRGGSGADMIFGGSGDDVLRGDSGDDLLTGGIGFDYLISGSGADTIRFNRAYPLYAYTH